MCAEWECFSRGNRSSRPPPTSVSLRGKRRSEAPLWCAHIDLTFGWMRGQRWRGAILWLTTAVMAKGSRGLCSRDLSDSLMTPALIRPPSCAPLDSLWALGPDGLNGTCALKHFLPLTAKASSFCWSSPLKMEADERVFVTRSMC